jgi:DNA-binding NarL/FixJ family response regulator
LAESERRGSRGEDGTGVTVLLVDDEPAFLKLMNKLLSGQPGLKVVGKASSAEDAMDLVPKLQPDVVVLDVNMPGMGGIRGAAKLRIQSPGVKIVIVSDLRERQYTSQAKAAGAHAFLPKKNLNAESLLAVLDSLG